MEKKKGIPHPPAWGGPKNKSDHKMDKLCNTVFKSPFDKRLIISAVEFLFLRSIKTRTLKFKNQLTFAFSAAVNHLNGPLRKQNFT